MWRRAPERPDLARPTHESIPRRAVNCAPLRMCFCTTAWWLADGLAMFATPRTGGSPRSTALLALLVLLVPLLLMLMLMLLRVAVVAVLSNRCCWGHPLVLPHAYGGRLWGWSSRNPLCGWRCKQPPPKQQPEPEADPKSRTTPSEP